MADSVERLIMQVQGQDLVERLTEAVRAETQAIRDLNAELLAGSITQAQFAAAAQPLGARLEDTQKELNKARAATIDLGRGILQASYAFQDFTGSQGNFLQKLSSIQNNLPQIIMMFGGPAGLAAAISAASVALALVIPKVIEFFSSLHPELLSDFGGSLAGLEAHLKELGEKAHKVSLDYQDITKTKREIEDAHKALDAFEAARKGVTETQQQVASLARENVVEFAGGTDQESGAENLRAFLRRQMKGTGDLTRGAEGLLNQQEAWVRQIEADRADVEKFTTGKFANPIGRKLARDALKESEGKLAGVQDELRKYGDEVISKLVGSYLEGNEAAREKIRATVEQAPKEAEKVGIGPQFRAGLELGGAAAVRQRQQDQRRLEQRQRLDELDADLVAKQAREGEEAAEVERAAIEARQKVVLDRIQAEGTLKEAAARAFQAARDRGIKDADQYDVVYKQLYNSLREELARRGAAPSGQLVEQAAARMAGEAPQVRATPQQVALDQLKDQPRVRAFAERAAEDARTRKLEGAELVADVQAKLLDAFQKELGKDVYKKQGVEPTGESVIQASRNLAEQALGTTAQKRTKQEEESVKASGLPDWAITALARGRQQGGFDDRRGRFRPMDVDQQFNAVLQQVMQSLAAHNPQMDSERVRDLATRIVTDARTQMEAMQQLAIQAQLGLGPDIARVLQATQGNPAAFQQEMAGMMRQAMMANNVNQIEMMQPMMNAQPNLINRMNQVGLDRVINRNRRAPQEGFRSVPPSTPGPGDGNGQAVAPTALLDRTLGAVGQEQAVVAGMQQVMGRLSAQLNQVVANVQKLQRNNGQLMTRNEPRQSTALDFSGRFA